MDARWKPILWTVAAIAAIFGALGLLDLGNVPYGGFFSGPTFEVTRVFPDSPAERAGFEVGDALLSIDGIEITDTRTLARRPRPEIGETRTFVVERDGDTLELGLTYSGLPDRQRGLALAAAAIGFCFLVLPLWAHHRAPSKSTLILALFGVAFGFAFLPGPYSSSYLLRTVAGAFATSCVVLGFAFLVHYLMRFPAPGGFLEKRWARHFIYGPAILLALFLIFLTATRPDATGSLNRFVGMLIGVFIVGFFGWALVVIVRTYLGADSGMRARHGLTLMLFGAVAGLVPVTLSSLVGAIAPQVQANLPGVQYFFLTLALIPFCFSLAAVRSARAG